MRKPPRWRGIYDGKCARTGKVGLKAVACNVPAVHIICAHGSAQKEARLCTFRHIREA